MKQLLVILSCIAVAFADVPQIPEKSPLLTVIEHESDPECLKEKNINSQSLVNEFATCMQDTIAGLTSALHPDSNPVEIVIDHICKSSTLVDCIHQMETTLGSCLNDDKKKKLAVQMKPVYVLIETTCENDASELKNLIAKGGECATEKKIELMMCAQAIAAKAETHHATTFEELQTAESCTDVEEFAKCAVTATATCEDDSLSKFIDHIFTNIIKNSYCADHH